MAVTLAQIAKKMGTTHATVSRALRDDASISPDTRKRVKKVAADLGYQANLMARGLKGRGTQVVGVLVTIGGGGWIPEMIANEGSARQFATFMSSSLPPEGQDIEAHCLGVLEQWKLRGVDAAFAQWHPYGTAPSESLIASLSEFRAAVLKTGRIFDDVPLDQFCLSLDNAFSEAPEYFLSKGRTRPALCLAVGTYHREQRDIFVNTLRRHGIETPPERILNPGVHVREQSLTDGMWRLLDETYPDGRVPFDAIFCYDDRRALAMVSWLLRKGYRIPEDVAIIGHNDIESARSAQVPLASFDSLNNSTVGRAAADMLFERLDQPDRPPQQVTIPTTFIWRESAG